MHAFLFCLPVRSQRLLWGAWIWDSFRSVRGSLTHARCSQADRLLSTPFPPNGRLLDVNLHDSRMRSSLTSALTFRVSATLCRTCALCRTPNAFSSVRSPAHALLAEACRSTLSTLYQLLISSYPMLAELLRYLAKNVTIPSVRKRNIQKVDDLGNHSRTFWKAMVSETRRTLLHESS